MSKNPGLFPKLIAGDVLHMKINHPNRERAVVMGGSIAGLLASRVLSEHFTKVTALERDPCPVDTVPRPGAPQGRHLHILLPAGVEALETLFPGRIAELVRDGAKRFDYGRSQIYLYGIWLPRVETELVALAQTRPFLEQHLRQWISEIPNVQVIYQVSAHGPLLDPSSSRVDGVEFVREGERRKQKLQADLVVDATGRNTRLLRWLSQNGFGGVPESKVGINLGYATGRFRVPEALLPDSPLLYIIGPPPHKTKVGVVFQVEDGIVFGGMGGYHGDHPPADPNGFLQFAKNLSQPDIFNVLSRAKLCSRIEQFRIPASIRRHYNKVRGFPDGLLPIGDTICSLDPAFGQGISIAALEAKILSQCLTRNSQIDGQFRKDYFRHADAVLDVAWDLSSRDNMRYSQTTGRRPWTFPLASRYSTFLTKARDPRVMGEIYKVISLTADPGIVWRPNLALRALRRAIQHSP